MARCATGILAPGEGVHAASRRAECAAPRAPVGAGDEGICLRRPKGKQTLGDLFEGRSQLVIYHAMFNPKTATSETSWTEDAACQACSFWLDNVNGIITHLNHRDVTLIAVSRAPISTIAAYQRRMGWTFTWVSSGDGDFNFDYGVSFNAEDIARKRTYYNYTLQDPPNTESPGVSVFYKDPSGQVFHTYSTYSRGLDMLNVAYHYLDIVPKGRDEGNQGLYWVRRHDEYDAPERTAVSG